MGRHAASHRRATDQRRWFGHGRTRALLTLGIVALLGTTGTFAYWTDSGTVTGGTIESGTLDLSAGPTTGSEGLRRTDPDPLNYPWTALTLSNMVPGESVARTLVVRNSGTAALKFNVKAKTTSNDLLSGANGLVVEIRDNSTAGSASGSESGGDRSQSCSLPDSVQLYSGNLSMAEVGPLYGTYSALPATGGTRNLCVRVSIPSTAPTSLQNKSTAVVLTLDAKQVAAP